MLALKIAVVAVSLFSHMSHKSFHVPFRAVSTIAFFQGEIPKPIVYSAERAQYASFIKVISPSEMVGDSEKYFAALVHEIGKSQGCVSVTPYGNFREKDVCMYYIEWKDKKSCTEHTEHAGDMEIDTWGTLQPCGEFPILRK